MNEPIFSGTEPTAQIDRLVSGDLSEAERRNLLIWLDEDCQRWRSCALAFLEAQAWEQAGRECSVGNDLRGDPGQESGARSQKPGVRNQESGASCSPSAHHSPLTTHHSLTLRQCLTLAALVLAALAIGVVAGRQWPVAAPQIAEQSLPGLPVLQSESNAPLVATVPIRTNLDPRLQAQLTLPVTPSEHAPPADLSISDYDRKQWERRGFEVSEEVRYLPARLPDGRQVMVPVNKVQLKVKAARVSS